MKGFIEEDEALRCGVVVAVWRWRCGVEMWCGGGRCGGGRCGCEGVVVGVVWWWWCGVVVVGVVVKVWSMWLVW